MAMNAFMHPRNPYRNPPDFTQLAIEYPEIRAIGTLDVNGRVRLDFRHDQTLRTLTACLLHRDFGLRVHLPVGNLVPTLPLRLNYILWLEDVLRVAGPSAGGIDTITGIDIGCGASCIYPLLAARIHPTWRLFALESNAHSVEHARANVAANRLAERIEIVQQQPQPPHQQRVFDTLLLVLAAHDGGQSPSHHIADFCMCNPPFFTTAATTAAAPANRTGHRPAPRLRLCTSIGNDGDDGDPKPPTSVAAADELSVAGGEVAFVARLIAESCELRTRVRIYTTMLGLKASVSAVRALLADRGVRNVAGTEFCQGRTTRWAIAWSFDDRIDLAAVPATGPSMAAAAAAASRRHHKPLVFRLTDASDQAADLRPLQQRLERLLADLGLRLSEQRHVSADRWLGRLMAVSCPWTNQRRQRRERQRAEAAAAAEAAEAMSTEDAHLVMAGVTAGDKRRRDEIDDGFYDAEGGPHETAPAAKRTRFEQPETEEESTPSDEAVQLCVKLAIRREPTEAGFALEMEYVSGAAGRDGAYQLMQCIQNRWK